MLRIFTTNTKHETQRTLSANNTDVSTDFLYVHSLMFFKTWIRTFEIKKKLIPVFATIRSNNEMSVSEGYLILSPTQLIISFLLILADGNMFWRYLNLHHQTFQ
jgi:hypothetical protein